MARKTQEEINYWFQDHTIKSGMDLSLIEKILHLNNLDTPNNIIIHKNGLIYDDFAKWYCDEVKENTYPKTYEDCCKVMGISYRAQLSYTYPDVERGNRYLTKEKHLLDAFMKLRICYNAYWKIAGEEMGLGKSWDSTYGCGEWGYWIGYSINENKIYLQDSRILVNHTLVFPTQEMRGAFYENFKDLIEQCKELL